MIIRHVYFISYKLKSVQMVVRRKNTLNIKESYHKSITILDEDISGSAETFEEFLQVAFPDAEG